MIGVNYGDKIAYEGYLRKFFSYEFNLPDVELHEYIEFKYGEELSLENIIGGFQEKEKKKFEFCYRIFLEIIKSHKISLREFQFIDKKLD